MLLYMPMISSYSFRNLLAGRWTFYSQIDNEKQNNISMVSFRQSKKQTTKCASLLDYTRYMLQNKQKIIMMLNVKYVSLKNYERFLIFTLLAAMMAHIPVGQKQHKQERTAGPIQLWGTGVRLISIAPGWVTCTKDVIEI